jgi:hypothetical protein
MSNDEETQPEQSQEGKSSAADALANQEEDPRFFRYSGPEKGVKYPREIIYCDGKMSDLYHIRSHLKLSYT